jgi:ubiquinone biosynthesis protein
VFSPAQLLRLFYINRVLVRHGLDDVIFATHLFRPLGFLRLLFPWNWFHRTDAPRGERIRRTLEDLGPMFVKFGQILSTRRDLLPEDIAVELAKLQDQVPPFPGALARSIVEQAYGRKINEVFASFDQTPLASASIAQVHSARLLDGTEVIVKVVRPDIKKVIKRDVSLLRVLAQLAERYWGEARRLHPLEVVDDYEKIIMDELDLLREAASASQLRRNFEQSFLLYVPKVHWEYTRQNVMVMERISGTPISNVEELIRAGIDLKQLAENGVEIFFTQVFIHNFFHADMHPGNIFVSPEGQYIAVDFGIMGTLNPEDQRYLAENFLAFFKRDYQRVAELHVESEWVPSGTRVDEFESAIRTVCEPIFERPLKDISFGHLLVRLFQTARRFNMEVQPQLVLLQKTLLNIEGLGRQLYPELDLWQSAKPFFERWMNEQIGPRAFINSVRRNASSWAEKMPEIPTLFYEFLQAQQSVRNKTGSDSGDINKLQREIRRANRITFRAITGSAFILAAAIIFGLDGYSPAMVGGAPLVSWVLGIFGIVVLLFAWPDDRD